MLQCITGKQEQNITWGAPLYSTMAFVDCWRGEGSCNWHLVLSQGRYKEDKIQSVSISSKMTGRSESSHTIMLFHALCFLLIPFLMVSFKSFQGWDTRFWKTTYLWESGAYTTLASRIYWGACRCNKPHFSTQICKTWDFNLNDCLTGASTFEDCCPQWHTSAHLRTLCGSAAGKDTKVTKFTVLCGRAMFDSQPIALRQTIALLLLNRLQRSWLRLCFQS